jgi:DeoR/GlpR family transcriptional regulator of sugar metabolism
MAKANGEVQHIHKRVKFNAAERQAKVAKLYLGRNTVSSMARMFDVTTTTIQRDLKQLRTDWQVERLEDTTEQITREIEELHQMESDCYAQWLATKDPVWMDKRIRIKERRAKLMGLDKPIQVQTSGETTVNVVMPDDG